jgi:hypothetical protein
MLALHTTTTILILNTILMSCPVIIVKVFRLEASVQFRSQEHHLGLRFVSPA